MNKILVISPSGNWYGSEQVLYDYLSHTELMMEVRAPANSFFLNKLLQAGFPHKIASFGQSMPLLYSQIFFRLMKGDYDTVYINEAGHIKYLSFLAKLFPNRKFVVHVRMLEDVSENRWRGAERNNLKVLSISQFIRDRLPVKSELIYDGYLFSNEKRISAREVSGELRIAVIGRITKTKGLGNLPDLIERLKELDAAGNYVFYLYGVVTKDMENDDLLNTLKNLKNVEFRGFEKDRNKVYASVDCVLHISSREALGRIFFEAIDYEKPFVGINTAGIGEIGQQLNLLELLAGNDQQTLVEELANRLILVRKNYAEFVKQSAESKKKAMVIFNPVSYAHYMDNLLGA